MEKAGKLDETNSKLCEKCNQTFLLSEFDRQFRSCKGKIRQICDVCNKQFTTLTGLNAYKHDEHNKRIPNLE
jgi:hypothetical protein